MGQPPCNIIGIEWTGGFLRAAQPVRAFLKYGIVRIRDYRMTTGLGTYYCFQNNCEMCDPDLTNDHNEPDLYPRYLGQIIRCGPTHPSNPGEIEVADNVKTAAVRVGMARTIKVEPPVYNAQTLNGTFDINITMNDLGQYWRVVSVSFGFATTKRF